MDLGYPASVVSRWQARGEEAVRQALATAYPRASAFKFHEPDRGAIQFECTVLRLEDLTIHRTVSTGYEAVSMATDTVRINLPISAGVIVTTRQGDLSAKPSVSGVAFCADEGVARKVFQDYSGFYMEFSKQQVARQVHLLLGTGQEIGRIASTIDLRAPVGLSLFRCVSSLFYEAEYLGAVGLGPIVRASRNDLILNLAAVAALPELGEQFTQRQRDGRSVPERARQQIDGRAGEPIRLSALAAELGVSLRALEAGFFKRFGCTPSDYLHDSRLRLARGRLLAATASTKVTGVALDCGFTNAGAFAGRYRAVFGELPSETLKKARG